MTSDRKKMLMLSSEDARNNGPGRSQRGVTTIGDLEPCLLGVIMSYLLLKDNVRASAVCKEWREVAKSVRVVEKNPWVISFLKTGELIHLFDPLQKKFYKLNVPELAGASVCYSKEGWLLMCKTSLTEMFFFNPYTRELITLPQCEFSFQAIAFSSAPTTGTCVLVAFKAISKHVTATSICYLGSSEWITKDFPCSFGFVPYMHRNVVYANDHFYCFALGGVLFDFDLASQTLNHQQWEEHISPDIHATYWLYDPQRVNFMEHKGELFLMYTCASERLEVYKLISSKWEQMSGTTFGGLTIFPSLYSSETRLDIPGMRNSVYFPQFSLKDKDCVTYSIDEGRYYSRLYKQPGSFGQRQKELFPRQSLWIEPPPENVLDLM